MCPLYEAELKKALLEQYTKEELDRVLPGYIRAERGDGN
jgi:hypothetical protein